jgi:hypothetical protein
MPIEQMNDERQSQQRQKSCQNAGIEKIHLRILPHDLKVNQRDQWTNQFGFPYCYGFNFPGL